MFTGIIESIGTVKSIKRVGEDLKIDVLFDEQKLKDIHVGDSIAVNGICLTVNNLNKKLLSFDVSKETSSRVSPLKISQKLNLKMVR